MDISAHAGESQESAGWGNQCWKQAWLTDSNGINMLLDTGTNFAVGTYNVYTTPIFGNTLNTFTLDSTDTAVNLADDIIPNFPPNVYIAGFKQLERRFSKMHINYGGTTPQVCVQQRSGDVR